MALQRDAKYPGRYRAATPGQPQGAFKNRTSQTIQDGAYLEEDWLNDWSAFMSSLLEANGITPNGLVDEVGASQYFQGMLQLRQVEPLNNDWNGFFDPKHQTQLHSPAGYPDTSGAGGTVYGADDEWSLGNYSSGAVNTISADDDGVIFSVGTYKLFTFTSEQLVLIDVNKVPVYLVDETGKRHFVNNSTNGVNVTKPDTTTLKVELTNAIFAELGITKVWEFFITAGVGYVATKSPEASNVDNSLRLAATSKMFSKSIDNEPAFVVGGGQLRTNCHIAAYVGGRLLTFSAGEVISTPTLLAGVDYAIYATVDGLIVSSNFTVPSGYTAETSRRIGGFHYGDNEYKDYSFYDLNFRPKCKDPRGMVIDVSGSRFWNDIYLLNSTPDALGTSAYNAQIADGNSPCKIPALWGGDGTAQYPNLTQYIAAEVLAAYGKRLPSHDEFEILALGSTAGYAAGTDPVTTKFDVNARSKNGSEQVSGHLNQWGKEIWDRGDGSSGYTWYEANTNGEGQVNSAGSTGVGAVLLGAHWVDSGYAGARASYWGTDPWYSSAYVGARGLCDHFQQI